MKQVYEGELCSMEFGQTNITSPTSQYLKCSLPLQHHQIIFTILLLIESSRVIIVILRALKIRGSNTGRENCNPKTYYSVNFMFCWPCTSIHLCNKNLMHYLSSVYFVNKPLHVSGMFVAHHQEVYCICTTIGTCCAFLPDDGLQICPKHVEVD